jgi:hypothetical protein
MRRFMLLWYSISLLWVTTNADSATRPLAAKTVGACLVACEQERFGCSNAVRDTLIEHGGNDFSPRIIRVTNLTVDNTASVLKWLGTHPKTHGMATDKGILLALEALYPCRR